MKNFKNIDIVEKQGFLIIKLDRSKVNAINLDLIEDLSTVWNQIVRNDNYRGVVLTGQQGYFSAGLDLFELLDKSKKEIKYVWSQFLTLQQNLLIYPKPFICAVSGYALGAGCMLASCADYRIMARGERHKIGMPEVLMNLYMPDMWHELYSYWLGGSAKALDYLFNSRLFLAEEALKVGLVNQVCELEDINDKSEKVMTRWLKSSDFVLQKTKFTLRKKLLEKVKINPIEVAEAITQDWDNPETTAAIKNFVTMRKQKKTYL